MLLQICWWCVWFEERLVMHVPSNANFEHNLLALPETPRMPSAEGFAECTISSTRQNYYLPSAYEKALGKQTTLGGRKLCRVPATWLCRVPKSRHSANAPLPSAAWAALGNKCHVRHTSPHTPVTTGPPLFFAECLIVCTRQRQSRAPHMIVTPLPTCCHECYTVRRPLSL